MGALKHASLPAALAVVLVLAALAALCALSPSAAYAAADDDIPGLPTALGETIEGVVDRTTDKCDVYSIALSEGEEVIIAVTDNDPGYASSSVYVRLFGPGSLAVGSADSLLRMVSDDTKSYMPAVSGTYYLHVSTLNNGMAYTLKVQRSSTPAITTPDSDDIPGIPKGNGTWSGVVDTDTDEDDVYAINLIAGQEATIRVADNDPGYASTTVYVRLFAPGSLAVSSADSLLRMVSDDTKSYMPAVSGTYYLHVSTLNNGMAYTITLTGAGEAPVTPPLSFLDVVAGHAYYTAIMDLASRGIIGGYGNGYFGLNDPPTRAQFAKMIVGALGIPANTTTATRFTDLGTPDAHGFPHVWVQAAFDHAITYGVNQAQTLYDPWRLIQRDQVVSMIVRGVTAATPGVLQTPPVGYGLFAGVAEPHGQNLRIAEYNGLLEGLIGLGPDWQVTANATRGEVAQILYNLLTTSGEL